jgi:type IV secretory pathway VirB2 component (pilin)
MTNTAFAYTLLQALPGKGTEISKLSDYLSWLFKFALAAAAFLAVLQIVIAGIQMIIGGASETARKNAKDRIWNAVWGLLLAFGAVLILETISPGQFTKMELAIPKVTIEAPAPTPKMEGEWVTKLADDSKTRKYLQDHSVYVNKDPCPNSYYDKNCTMVSDLPQNAVDGVIKIADETGSAITITGGTEIGVHKEHGPNKPILDLRYKSAGGENPNVNLKLYLDQQVGKTMKHGDRLNTKDGKMNILFEKNNDGSEHFHITFK